MTASQHPFAIKASASKAARALDAPHPVTPYWTPACLEYSQRLWLPTGPAWEKEAHKTVVNAEGEALSPSWFAHRQLMLGAVGNPPLCGAGGRVFCSFVI
jgi:hypothetical protein